jgi:hypothetical protein
MITITLLYASELLYTAAEPGMTPGGCSLFFLPALLSSFFLLKFVGGLRGSMESWW